MSNMQEGRRNRAYMCVNDVRAYCMCGDVKSKIGEELKEWRDNLVTEGEVPFNDGRNRKILEGQMEIRVNIEDGMEKKELERNS